MAKNLAIRSTTVVAANVYSIRMVKHLQKTQEMMPRTIKLLAYVLSNFKSFSTFSNGILKVLSTQVGSLSRKSEVLCQHYWAMP
jgi:hypothetical protein